MKSIEDLRTPALLIDTDVVRNNIECMKRLLRGDLSRWRPHLKTVKVPAIMRMLVEAGVRTAKCATSGELLAACESGFEDVLVAFPHMGANADRIAAIARQFPQVRVSALVEAEEQLQIWRRTPVSLFLDVNIGMNRTGTSDAVRLLKSAPFRGIHAYDGHATEANLEERTAKAHEPYRHLMQLAGDVREVITTGTPALPCAISFEEFSAAQFHHQVSPGTIVYCDLNSLSQLPGSYGFSAAVSVLTRVVSHPLPNVITCDAGHKAVSVDSGVPNCAVQGYPELRPLHPSEEHLPIEIPQGMQVPELGSLMLLTPRHVCPTVNNANFAVLVRKGVIQSVESVSARGHERPL